MAAATLCAPALAATALAGIGATGGGDSAGMGSLTGTHGLRGSTEQATSTFTPAGGGAKQPRFADRDGKPRATVSGHGAAPPQPKTEQPAREPGHRAPSSPPDRSGAAPRSPSYPTDPTGPGAPTTSDSTAPAPTPTPTDGDSSSGSGGDYYGGSTSGSGTDGQSSYSGGG